MNNEPHIFITFLLAITGYAGLTIVTLISISKRIPLLLWRITALIILVHVFYIWNFYYEWQFSVSVRNGYTGFIIFHTALIIILVSTITKEVRSKILIRISFLVVTAGAVGAVLRYDIVEVYRIPVFIFAAAGSAGVLYDVLIQLKTRRNVYQMKNRD